MKSLRLTPNKLMAACLLGCFGLALAWPALAQLNQQDLGLGFGTATGLSTTDIRTTVGTIINAFLGLLGITAVGLIVYGGTVYMLAKGEQREIDRAKKIIVNAAIGLAIVMSAYAIAYFVLNAIIKGTGGVVTGDDGCPVGMTCGGLPPQGASFAIASTNLTGPGPNDAGWPKNYPITVRFTMPLLGTSASDQNVTVIRCNPRLDGDGNPVAFDVGQCNQSVAGTVTPTGKQVTFLPPPDTDGNNYFDGNYWYYLQLNNSTPGGLESSTGKTLFCPIPVGDLENLPFESRECRRAIAFNDMVDTSPPAVSIGWPQQGVAICQASTPASAMATDDFRVDLINFSLLDEAGAAAPLASFNPNPNEQVNSTAANSPFSATADIVASALNLSDTYTLRVNARDPRTDGWSQPVSVDFGVKPAHCCNGVQDEDSGELGVDCGGDCGLCPGQQCAEDGDCASGVCEDGVCVALPRIESVEPIAGGPGTLVTIRGVNFGSTAGQLEFYNSGQSLEAVPCAPGAWDNGQIVVKAPEGMLPPDPATGILEEQYFIRLTRGDGRKASTDMTDPDYRAGWAGVFTNDLTNKPGICQLVPNTGRPGDGFKAVGDGFGEGATSDVSVGFGKSNPIQASVQSRTATEVAALVPTAPGGGYPIEVSATDGSWKTANYPVFGLLGTSEAAKPVITGISPTAGPIDSYVTLMGRGFGRAIGKVTFKRGSGTDEEIALAAQTECSDSWKDNYVIVKVPEIYDILCGDVGGNCDLEKIVHQVELTTSAGDVSAPVNFTVNNDPLSPGLCSVWPDNGPPGTQVTVRGASFGSGPGSPATSPPVSDVGWSCADSGQADCDNQPGGHLAIMAQADGSGWGATEAQAPVPGQRSNQDTWPEESGEVRLWSVNRPSSNTLPFLVQDCNQQGGDAFCQQSDVSAVCCAAGFCDNGSTNESGRPCDYLKPSEFGWQLSTETLPVPPYVVSCASCGMVDCPLTAGAQSPSPIGGSTDACVNAEISAVISQVIESPIGGLDTAVKVEECTDQTLTSCSNVTASMVLSMGVAGGGSMSDFRIRPRAAYNGGLLKGEQWYRITLLSDGIRETSPLKAALDGDRDQVAGGDFVWSFRTRNSPCDLNAVNVTPNPYNIAHWDEPWSPPDPAPNGTQGFYSRLAAANCNSIVCDTGAYAITWDLSDSVTLNMADPPGTSTCYERVKALKETDADSPIDLTARARPVGDSGFKEGISKVTAVFADPKVNYYAPSCDQACVNAAVVVGFNTPMDSASLIQNAQVKILTCRNQSCNPPFDSGTAALFSPQLEDSDRLVAFSTINPVGSALTLEADKFYRVLVQSGPAGVKSKSGKELTGTNYDYDGKEWFSWTFRTKASNLPCTIHHADITPPNIRLDYVGQQRALAASPFGSPDECSASGQRLSPGGVDWIWGKTGNNVVRNFLRNGGNVGPVDTSIALPLGCSSSCLKTGSQTGVSQCGNGTVEDGEDCDGGAGCSSTDCLNLGTSNPVCGNGVLDPGEDCDGGAAAIPGCDPATCLNTGSAAGNSVCGDGYLADGEDCDGTWGCSDDCLNTGSLPSCQGKTGDAAVPGYSCTDLCGNGLVEPSEECDGSPGCNSETCLWLGTTVDCGNGTDDPGEDTGCDLGDGNYAEWCGPNCRNLGSSWRYLEPSFCGDGQVGRGEDSRCEASPAGPDGYTDPFQAFLGGIPIASAVDKDTNLATDTVTAGTSGMGSTDDYGSATVSLVCACLEKGAQPAPDQYCEGLTVDQDLGCSAAGCCAPAPQVIDEESVPKGGAGEVCRNSLIEVKFDQTMDELSLADGLSVGWEITDPNNEQCTFCDNDPDRPCGDDSDCTGDGKCAEEKPDDKFTLLAPPADGEPEEKGIWQRLASALRRLIGQPVSASTNGTGVYCRLPGTISTYDDTAYFQVKSAMRPNREHAVLVRGGTDDPVLSKIGVAMKSDNNRKFTTSDEICKIDYITLDPASYLISALVDDASTPNLVEDKATLQAFAHSSTRGVDTKIVPVAEYGFKWTWSRSPDTSPVYSSGTTKNAVSSGNGVCEAVDGGPTEANDSDECPVGATPVTPGDEPVRIAEAREGGEFPKNGVEDIQVTADSFWLGQPDGSFTANSRITVMLCENPWPARATDGSWAPWQDDEVGVSFHYCRRVTTAGDQAGDLPALTESPVRIDPARPDILHEWLFTFVGGNTDDTWYSDAIGYRIVTNPGHLPIADWYSQQGFFGAPPASTTDGYGSLKEGRTLYVGSAAKPAALNKIFTNANVFSYNDGAAPETAGVFGQIAANLNFNYALTDYRYCRVDGSSTAAQGLVGGEALSCSTDLDCRVDADGEFVDGQSAWVCDADRTKLRRDVQRWADLFTMRDDLYRASRLGDYPDLAAGTFLRGWTTSAWPSWNGVLASAAGRSAMPTDPAQGYMKCHDTNGDFEEDTCWNPIDKSYSCREGSQVYSYRALGGQDYVMDVDFEYDLDFGNESGLYDWVGNTCWEIGDSTSCNADADCIWKTWTDSAISSPITYQGCQYRTGGFFRIPKVNDLDTSCAVGGVVGTAGQCGDGEHQQAESCDPTDPNAASNTALSQGCNVTNVCLGNASQPCGWSGGTDSSGDKPPDSTLCGDAVHNPANCVAVTGGPRPGVQQRPCTGTCELGLWGSCSAGVCGDGLIQAAAGETCDDGELNGKYGYCPTSCQGEGPYCGDGKVNPGEKCDCSNKGFNGTYAQDGVLALPGESCSATGSGSSPNYTPPPSCSWDCSGPGPRCGDKIKNGSEDCDGGSEEYPKICIDKGSSGSNPRPVPVYDSSDDTKITGYSGISGSYPDKAYVGCKVDTDCGTDQVCAALCDPKRPERVWRRSCYGNDANSDSDNANACTWSTWTCSSPGTCGDGVKQTGEECDDGNADNTDSCIIDAEGLNPRNKPVMCKSSVCGDGYVNTSAGEQCDTADKLNEECVAEYGKSCSYCSDSCKLIYKSGGYCGDNVIQRKSSDPPGPEMCDNDLGMENYTCVSERKEDQIFGRETGPAFCDGEAQCIRACEDKSSKPCEDKPSDANSDASGEMQEYYTKKSGSTDDETSLPKIDLGWIDQYKQPQPTILGDSCDPDADDDGVPRAKNDCNDTDPDIHPGYETSWVDEDGVKRYWKVDEVTEICDNKDNDCDRQIDEYVMKVTGKVTKGVAGTSVGAGIDIEVYCVPHNIVVQATPEEPKTSLLTRFVNWAKSLLSVSVARAYEWDAGTLIPGSGTVTDSSGNYETDVSTENCPADGNDLMIVARPPSGDTCLTVASKKVPIEEDPTKGCDGTVADLEMGEKFTITGVVKHVQTGNVVNGVTVGAFCNGVLVGTSKASGPPEFTNNGEFSLQAAANASCPSGVEIKAGANDSSKYCATPVEVGAGSCTGPPKTVEAWVSPTVEDGKIVSWIRWNQTPSDLDFHLYTSGTVGSHHVFYGNKNSGDLDLDLDDTNSWGPETITINSLTNNSHYDFWVYNYSGSNWGVQTSPVHLPKAWSAYNFTDSNGVSECKVDEYEIPVSTGGNRGWHLFTIGTHPATGSIKICPVNGLSSGLPSGASTCNH